MGFFSYVGCGRKLAQARPTVAVVLSGLATVADLHPDQGLELRRSRAAHQLGGSDNRFVFFGCNEYGPTLVNFRTHDDIREAPGIAAGAQSFLEISERHPPALGESQRGSSGGQRDDHAGSCECKSA